MEVNVILCISAKPSANTSFIFNRLRLISIRTAVLENWHFNMHQSTNLPQFRYISFVELMKNNGLR